MSRSVAKQGISLFVIKQILAAFPEADVRVHAASVVIKQRLWHECCRLPVLPCSILDNIFVHHHLISHSQHRSVAHVYLALACSGNLMMMAFNPYSGSY